MSTWQDERMEAPRIGPVGYALVGLRGLALVGLVVVLLSVLSIQRALTKKAP